MCNNNISFLSLQIKIMISCLLNGEDSCVDGVLKISRKTLGNQRMGQRWDYKAYRSQCDHHHLFISLKYFFIFFFSVAKHSCLPAEHAFYFWSNTISWCLCVWHTNILFHAVTLSFQQFCQYTNRAPLMFCLNSWNLWQIRCGMHFWGKNKSLILFSLWNFKSYFKIIW